MKTQFPVYFRVRFYEPDEGTTTANGLTFASSLLEASQKIENYYGVEIESISLTFGEENFLLEFSDENFAKILHEKEVELL
jgi:hypothetical protein